MIRTWKRIFILLKFFILILTSAILSPNQLIAGDARLLLIQGKVLEYIEDGEAKTIKRAEFFYGYGFLDQNRIFVAYQSPEFAAALAILEVIDQRSGAVVYIMELGSAGETNFDVFPETGYIVFNDAGGIHLLFVTKQNTYQLYNVVDGANAFCVFWIDRNTIGASIFMEDKFISQKIDVSKVILKAQKDLILK